MSTTGSYYYPLFEHLSREHGLTLVESELTEIVRIAEKLSADARRLDWLADRENEIGQVLLPREIVEKNLTDMRRAIDEAMLLPNT